MTTTDDTDGEPDDYAGAVLGGGGSAEVACRECGGLFGQITASHLSLHGMTVEEYKREYPGAPLQSPEVVDAGGWTDAHDDDTRRRIAEAASGDGG